MSIPVSFRFLFPVKDQETADAFLAYTRDLNREAQERGATPAIEAYMTTGALSSFLGAYAVVAIRLSADSMYEADEIASRLIDFDISFCMSGPDPEEPSAVIVSTDPR